LTEIERYESRAFSSSSNATPLWPQHQQQHVQHPNANGNINDILNLEGHIQLLATMSCRAAKRCPPSDQKLVEVCLSNAAHYHGSSDQAQRLIENNRQMCERVMGRIAAIAFDNHFHQSHQGVGRPQLQQTHNQSAFSNPIAIANFCAIVAANSISTGPGEFIHLVSDLIIPNKDNLPPLSVAAIAYHLACEAMGKSASVGMRDALKNKLFGPVVSTILTLMLQESVRESDVGDRAGDYGNGKNNQRIAAMVLKAIERWCAATDCSLIAI
jgi:hypothetical protein